jgi:mono/diheme cytochrome c family protein
MDELLKKVAEMRGMPASLVERSAKARADQTGSTVEAVLAEWAGEKSAETETPAAATPEPESPPVTAAEDAPADAPTDFSTDSLVQLAADAKRMPPRLILSSAQARADNSNSSLEEVLATWAGVDLEATEATTAAADTPPPAEEPPLPPPAEEPETAPPATAPVVAAAAVAGSMSMDDLLARVAEVKGMPAALAKRSAEARAKKTGEPLEAVLAEWAGVDASEVAPQETAAAPPPASEDAKDVPPDEPESSGDIEVLEATEPEAEASGDADNEAPTRRGRYPSWLAAAFVLIPLLAVAYILVVPNGPDCGTAGQLDVDPATGLAVNCDGSEYGSSTADYFAAGAAIYAQCAACHSADGSGGVGPAFAGGAVLATFPSGQCTDHISWVGLGTANWPEPTYGATNISVGGVGVMPGFAGSLSEQQLAEVSLYERVQFGGQPLEEAEVDCGLVEGEGGETVEAAAP